MNSWKKKPRLLHKWPVMNAMKLARVIEADTMIETAIIEQLSRRESSVEEALIDMYPAGVSVRRVEDITEVLWGTKIYPGTISELNKKAYARIEVWRSRPSTGKNTHTFTSMESIFVATWAVNTKMWQF